MKNKTICGVLIRVHSRLPRALGAGLPTPPFVDRRSPILKLASHLTAMPTCYHGYASLQTFASISVHPRLLLLLGVTIRIAFTLIRLRRFSHYHRSAYEIA